MMLPGNCQKVYGGWLVGYGWVVVLVVCKPILVFSFGFDQAEQLKKKAFIKHSINHIDLKM